MKNKRRIFYLILLFLMLIFVLVYFNQIISNFYKVGINYFESSGDYTKAEILLKQNLYIQDKLSRGSSVLLIKAVDGIVSFYDKQGLYNKSEKIYEKYLPVKIAYSNKTTSTFLDNSKLNLAKVYSDLGTIKLKQKKYNESEYYYKKSLIMKKNNLNKSSIYIDNKLFTIDNEEWVELNNLGFLKIQEKKYEQAKFYLNESLISDKYKKNSYPWQIYYNLSILYRELGNYKLAEKYAETLLINSPPRSEILPMSDTSNYKLNFIRLSSKFNSFFKKNLAEIYIKEKRYDEAVSLMETALFLDKDLYNKKAPEVLCDHYKLFDIYKNYNSKDSKKLMHDELMQINTLKLNILSTKNYSGDKLTSQLENICKY